MSRIDGSGNLGPSIVDIVKSKTVAPSQSEESSPTDQSTATDSADADRTG
jgi:hypothetical protein